MSQTRSDSEDRRSSDRPYLPAGQILFSAPEVAAIFGVHLSTVHRWAAEGVLQMGRITPRYNRVRRSEVERLIDKLYADRDDTEKH